MADDGAPDADIAARASRRRARRLNAELAPLRRRAEQGDDDAVAAQSELPPGRRDTERPRRARRGHNADEKPEAPQDVEGEQGSRPRSRARRPRRREPDSDAPHAPQEPHNAPAVAGPRPSVGADQATGMFDSLATSGLPPAEPALVEVQVSDVEDADSGPLLPDERSTFVTADPATAHWDAPPPAGSVALSFFDTVHSTLPPTATPHFVQGLATGKFSRMRVGYERLVAAPALVRQRNCCCWRAIG